MSKTSHLFRRGNTLYFRLSVPFRFRKILKVSEFTKSLRTQNLKEAAPAAYKLAGQAKHLFLNLDNLMTEYSDIDDELLEELLAAAEKAEDEAERVKSLAVKKGYNNSLQKLMVDKKHSIAMDVLKEQHQEELELLRLKIKAESFDKLSSLNAVVPQAPLAQQPIIEKVADDNSAPLLSVVFEQFYKKYANNPESQKKHKAFKNLFIDNYLGDKRVNLVTQKEVNDFFKLIVQVGGGRGGKTEAYSKLSIHERIEDAKKSNDVLMSLGTFKNTYLGSARQFFNYVKLHHEDYSPTVTVEHISYKDFGGLRAKGENKQRALKLGEISILMTSNPMEGFAKSVKMSHKFWLPMIGLFTGARVNEICQLNPQYDVTEDSKTGIWYFNLTSEEAGADIKKSLKNDHSKRKVPIHSKLIECGFLKYLTRVKALGHDRIFNGFKPKSGKASYYAESFFREYLRSVHLYDDKTIGRNVLGMHCIRSSFMTHLVNGLEKSGVTGKQALSKIQPIVGHCDGLSDENGKDLSITNGYVDRTILDSSQDNLSELKEVIEFLNYDIKFPC